ncbi:MAG TPA: ISL3 family transposase, partial [Flavisolibacter sp.]|nr:ISL3 family transposase [Flavisolibacter sp.]
RLLNLQGGYFILRHTNVEQGILTLVVESRSKRCRCPLCHRLSHNIHSRYQRHLKDLPCLAKKTIIHLTSHKFYCRNPHCPQKVFTERFAAGIGCSKRMTNRLSELLLSLTLQVSGRSAERICRLLHIEVSDTTLGRLVQMQPLPQPATPKILGVDDWALKKRSRYGTILVDLERHKIIDLLRDRETATLKQWLGNHPGVLVVSRDRYTNYANAVTAALPGCTQVADRWHLLKNLCDGLGKLVERNHQQLKYAREKELQRLQRVNIKSASEKPLSDRKAATQNFSRRLWQLQQIKSYQSSGISIKATAHLLGMSRNTVKKYLHLQEPPRRKFSVQVNIALFDDYIRGRIQQEPAIQLMQLYREIKERGYNGGRTSAFVHLHEYVNRQPRFAPPRLPDIFYLPSRVPFLLLRSKQQLTAGERKLVSNLCLKCPQIRSAYGLAREFKELIKQKKGNLLQKWVSKTVTSGIGELKGFASGVLSDLQAVKNAFNLSWSNGQVEGQINKLKTIKRQMYGRASFDFLRKRLLLNSS